MQEEIQQTPVLTELTEVGEAVDTETRTHTWCLRENEEEFESVTLFCYTRGNLGRLLECGELSYQDLEKVRRKYAHVCGQRLLL